MREWDRINKVHFISICTTKNGDSIGKYSKIYQLWHPVLVNFENVYSVLRITVSILKYQVRKINDIQ